MCTLMLLRTSSRSSPLLAALVSPRAHAHTRRSIPLKILSIEDGTELKSFSHSLQRNKKVDFVEQFNEKLLVKVCTAPGRMDVHVRTGQGAAWPVT